MITRPGIIWINGFHRLSKNITLTITTSKLLQKFLKRSQISLTWTHTLCEFHRQFLPLSTPRCSFKHSRPSHGSAEAAAIRTADLPRALSTFCSQRPTGLLALTTVSWGKGGNPGSANPENPVTDLKTQDFHMH